METYNAIIVGFGPTGATMANLLGSMGLRVAVVERDLQIFDQPRAITADHEALRAFQAVGLADAVEVGTCPHPGTDFVGVDGQVIKQFYPMPSPGPLGWEPTFMFHQPTLETVLRQGVERFDAVDVMLGHKLIEFHQDAEGVEAIVSGPGEARHVLRADYLLACDGARSLVRTGIKARLHDLAFDEWWVVVDTQLHTDIDLPERCVQYCRPSRPGTYIVGPGRLRRWEIKVMPGEDPSAFNNPEYVNRVLASFVDTSAVDVQRVAVYRFHAVVAEKWRDRRVFLMGDAAHQMPPFLGQGMCAGLRDAYNLAWKLEAVLKGRAPDSLLDTYGEERRPHVQTVVAHAKSFGLVIGELDESAAVQRDERLAAELAAGTAPTIRQSFIPGLEAGLLGRNVDSTLVKGAGLLFPQPWVIDGAGGRARLDDLVRGDFYAVSNDQKLAEHAAIHFESVNSLAKAKSILLEQSGEIGHGVVAVRESEAIVERWLAENDARLAIVRPDGFAYGVALDVEGVTALISQLEASLTLEESVE